MALTTSDSEQAQDARFTRRLSATSLLWRAFLCHRRCCMLRSIALVLLLAVPASASQLLSELTWTQYPDGRRGNRADYYLTVGTAPVWHVGDMTHAQSGEYFVADSSTAGWDAMVQNLLSGSDVTLSSSGQSGSYEQSLPVPSLAGNHIDWLEFELYDFGTGRVDLSVYGTQALTVPEPSSFVLLLSLLVFSMRSRSRP